MVIAEQGRWYTALPRPLFAFAFVIYVWKVVVWDKVLGLGITDPLSAELSQWAMIILTAYFGGRSIEKVARNFGEEVKRLAAWHIPPERSDCREFQCRSFPRKRESSLGPRFRGDERRNPRRFFPMDVFEAVASRYSCRAFLPTPIPKATVRDIVERAARAPSAGNMQPWRIYAIGRQARLPNSSACWRRVWRPSCRAARATTTRSIPIR